MLNNALLQPFNAKSDLASRVMKKVQRTIKRLSQLRKFAKKIRVLFDIENLDISNFHYQGNRIYTNEKNYLDLTPV